MESKKPEDQLPRAMKTSDFDYILPNHFIAQIPIEPRDAARLLVLHRDTGEMGHAIFRDIGNFLKPGDLMVVNKTRVIPARLFGRKPTGGRVEILLLHRIEGQTWECIVGGKGIKAGSRVQLDNNGPEAEITEDLGGPRRVVRFLQAIDLYLPRIGHVPLPPYIHKPLVNPERYQTVFAREPGSAAAPTAGLHFTPRLIQQLRNLGINFGEVTLHVGLDTFAPVTERDPREHKIHTEWCQLSQETADLINQTKASGGRIVAVGTTSVRTLESAAARPAFSQSSMLEAFTGQTDLFILPGYQFKLVDGMVTNFHLPFSTLIMLVSAFAGRKLVLDAYEVAKKENYRFYSFGDAMLIL